MIRDVLTGHKKVHFFPAVAFLQFKKKVCNAFMCRFVAQKQAMVLSALQFYICDCQQMLSHDNIGCGA